MITMGCDIGSLYAKAVVLEDDRILGSHVMQTSVNFSERIEAFLGAALAEAGIQLDRVECLGATGNGADMVKSATFMEETVPCIGAAVSFFLPEVRYAVDVGGQSITCLAVDELGEMVNLLRNDKCASGSGRFLEMACRKLQLDFAELNQAAQGASRSLPISNQCGVFAESEIITYVNAGESVPDIMAGVCEALTRIVGAQCRRFGMEGAFTTTGGVVGIVLCGMTTGSNLRDGTWLP